MIIKIPPVSGLAYKVQAGETITAIADKFKVSADKIREQNRLAAGQELLLGQDLLIPGAIRIANPSKDTPAQVVASAE
jgi:LysM repeat protein